MKNKKLKKKFKQEILAQALRKETQSAPQTIPSPSGIVKNVSQNLGQDANFDVTVIKSDLVKIAFVFGILILLVVILHFINLKYPLINNLANFLTKVLHIN